MGETPGSIASVLGEQPKDGPESPKPTTAVFYSISNCQEGLRGISFGNFLIKQVAEDLARELPSLTTFVTLSPVPGFAAWLERLVAEDGDGVLAEVDRAELGKLKKSTWHRRPDDAEALRRQLLPLAAHYFLKAKSSDGRPLDPVARFHLGNGAMLERINWLGDISEKGLREAHGLMVNYRYDLAEIERNHEAFANDGQVVASRAVRGMLRAPAKPTTPASGATRLLALSRRKPATVNGGEPAKDKPQR